MYGIWGLQEQAVKAGNAKETADTTLRQLQRGYVWAFRGNDSGKLGQDSVTDRLSFELAPKPPPGAVPAGGSLLPPPLPGASVDGSKASGAAGAG